jgi:hypothetical protein
VPFLFPFFVGLRFFSDTEEHLIPALNVLFWNQVVEANQFISRAFAPLISWFCGGRILFVLRCIHLGSLADISISAKCPTAGTKAGTVATFVVKPEGFIQPIISLIAKMLLPREGEFQRHNYAVPPQI